MKKYISSIIIVFFIATCSFAQIDRSKQPKSGPAPAINFSEPDSFNLPNGLTVLVVENHKLPVVRAQLLIDNPLHAAGAKVGVENLLSQMLGSGTTTIPKDKFNEQVDYLGASIFFGSESAYANSLSEYFPQIMQLMADAIKNPLFTEEEFQKEKDKLMENLKNQEKDVSNIANNINAALIYGKDHPKGEFTTAAAVEKLTLADVRNYFGDYFNPKNAYLAIVGDVNFSQTEELIRQNLSDWKASTIPMVDYATPKDAQYTQVNFVDMPNAVQSEIAIENLVNLKMGDPDYFAVLIANKILGGGFNSLLNMNLREAHGWTYGARSNTGADKNITRFIASTSVRNAVTDSAVVESLKEIRNIRDIKVTPQQLATAKAKFVGDFVLALERPETIAQYALQVKTQNLDDDFYIDYLKKINTVTAEDVERVAKKYYKPDNLRIVVVGKGLDVQKGLENLKSPNGKAIPVNYYDKFGNPAVKLDYNKPLDTGVSAETVINKYIEAIGGRKALEDVNTLNINAVAEMQGMQLGLEMIKTAKNQSSVVVSMGGNSLQSIKFNGEKGYVMAQGQKLENNENQNMTAKMESAPFIELTAKEANLERVEPVDGQDAYVLSLGNGREAYYDKESALKVKEVSKQEMMGQSVSVITTYSNYKEVNGIKFPHTIGQIVGPQQFTFNITNIKINEGVTDADFE